MSEITIEMTDEELMDRLRAIARQRQQQPMEPFRIPLETHSEWIAADRIASLKAENDRLREALKPFANACECIDMVIREHDDPTPKDDDAMDYEGDLLSGRITYGEFRRARDALSPTEEKAS